MKIPLFYIPKTRFKKFLHIEKKYISDEPIIPLGCNCHPAHMLKQLHIRTQSFPFDWLSVHPSKGLNHVCENIEENFSFFLSDLQKNEKGHVYSAKYPCVLFYHEEELIDSPDDREKLYRRVKRFLEFLNDHASRFLYMTTSRVLIDQASVEAIYDSIVRFTRLMKDSDKLYIYIKHEETLDENRMFVDRLMQKVQHLDRTYIAKYLKQTNRFGLWGDKNKFPDVFNRLKLPIRKAVWPKIFLR